LRACGRRGWFVFTEYHRKELRRDVARSTRNGSFRVFGIPRQESESNAWYAGKAYFAEATDVMALSRKPLKNAWGIWRR
jgi:hypothetical protein